jgi:hypothetical protein
MPRSDRTRRGAARALPFVAVLALVAMPLSAQAPAADPAPPSGAAVRPAIDDATVAAARAALVARHGQGEAARIDRGLAQVRDFWRPEDGDAAAFRAFAEAEFVPVGPELDLTFERFEAAMEAIGGYLTSMVRDLRRGSDLEIGPLLPLDRRLAGFNPGAHLSEDLFANQIAFVALLNFPRTTLEEKLAHGDEWTRRQWAESRLAGGFASRVPAEVNQAITSAFAAADSYINGYNVFLHHLVDDDGARPFPPDLRLISHWGLRDELKARYADPEGLIGQRTIARVFDRIVRQEIPAAVIDDPRFDWNPFSNQVTPSGATSAAELTAAGLAHDAPAPAAGQLDAREPDERYRRWLEIFRAVRRADPYSPDNPSFIARRFEEDREIPEAEVRALFETVLTAPLGRQVGALVAERLGRPLEPFDIWYVGFRPRGAHTEAQLDAITKSATRRRRLRRRHAAHPARPRLLRGERARSPPSASSSSRRAAPATPSARPAAATRRTCAPASAPDGMDYKGYNIAVHELGHNVEQVSQLNFDRPHAARRACRTPPSPRRWPSSSRARPRAARPREGRAPRRSASRRSRRLLGTREIAGVGLVDMAVWRWLYEHPEATPAELREAVVGIARRSGTAITPRLRRFATQTILAVYSHMIDAGSTLPDYPLGHLIAFQVEDYFRSSERSFGDEFERVSKLGRLTPDLWMRQAVGAPLSAEPSRVSR